MSHMHNPAHPGSVLKDGWPEGITITEAAQQLGITRATLSRIMNGHASITADMALRLQAWMGINAEMWLRLQAAHDLWRVKSQPRPHIVKLEIAA